MLCCGFVQNVTVSIVGVRMCIVLCVHARVCIRMQLMILQVFISIQFHALSIHPIIISPYKKQETKVCSCDH